MRGFIQKRGNGYRIALRTGRNPTTGKYEQFWETIKGNKKDAEKRLAELLHQIDTGNFIKPIKETLSNFLNSWLRDYAKMACASRTYESYEMIVKLHLIPALGSIPLFALRREHIQRYCVQALEKGRCDGKGGLSALTVHKHHRVLFEALR